MLDEEFSVVNRVWSRQMVIDTLYGDRNPKTIHAG